eukprot:gene24406-26193_t
MLGNSGAAAGSSQSKWITFIEDSYTVYLKALLEKMLCEIGAELGFFATWMIMTALGLLSMLILSVEPEVSIAFAGEEGNYSHVQGPYCRHIVPSVYSCSFERWMVTWVLHHHRFYNPSPFAVIADEYLDQFVRTWPMVILPAITPINMDLLFVIFATLFYGYG